MVNHYKEDSHRSRVTKQMCHHDPGGALGCLPDTLAFEAGNMRGTLGGILGECGPLLLDLGDGTPDGTFAGFPLPPALIATGTDVNQGSPVPTRSAPDVRRVRSDLRGRRNHRHAGVLVRLRPDDADDRRGLPGDELPVADRLQLDHRRPCRTTGRRSRALRRRHPDQRDRLGDAARLAQRQRPRRRRVLAQLRPVGPGSRSVVGRSCGCPPSSTGR